MRMRKLFITLTTAALAIGAVAPRTATQNLAIRAAPQSSELAEADRLENSASISFSKRDFEKATDLLKKSLAIRERVLGIDHPEVAETLHALANIYQTEREYSKAEPLYLRAISILDIKLGVSHPDTIETLTHYACMDLKLSNHDKADAKKSELIRRANCHFFGFTDCSTASFVSNGILNPSVTSWVIPPYPRDARVTEMIYVYVTVNELGRVTNAYAPCGDPLLTKAASDAARQAVLKPKIQDGKAYPMYGVLVYKFVHQ
jgi:tetratricopeptide (TPR) repeat protein